VAAVHVVLRVRFLTLPELVDAYQLSYVSFAVWAGVAVRVRLDNVIQRRTGLTAAQTAAGGREVSEGELSVGRRYITIVSVAVYSGAADRRREASGRCGCAPLR